MIARCFRGKLTKTSSSGYPFQPQPVYHNVSSPYIIHQNKLFGDKNNANDYTQQFIYNEKQNSPKLFTSKL